MGLCHHRTPSIFWNHKLESNGMNVLCINDADTEKTLTGCLTSFMFSMPLRIPANKPTEQ